MLGNRCWEVVRWVRGVIGSVIGEECRILKYHWPKLVYLAVHIGIQVAVGVHLRLREALAASPSNYANLHRRADRWENRRVFAPRLHHMLNGTRYSVSLFVQLGIREGYFKKVSGVCMGIFPARFACEQLSPNAARCFDNRIILASRLGKVDGDLGDAATLAASDFCVWGCSQTEGRDTWQAPLLGTPVAMGHWIASWTK